MRIAIAGPPKTGKTTLAASVGVDVLHTDDVLHLGWSAASDEVSRWFDADAFCIEGVAVLRALRKWRERNPSSPPPLDQLVMLWDPRVPYTQRGQHTMAAQLATLYAELEHWLAPVLSCTTVVGTVASAGGDGEALTPNGRRRPGNHPPVPISCAKIDNSRTRKEKPASKPPRVRGERKFSLAAVHEPAPDAEPRGADIAPIVTTAYLQAFEKLGGVTGLVRWGRRNPSAFYRTLASMAPALGRHAKGHGLVVQVAQFGDKQQQGRVIDGTAEKAADDPDPE